MRLFGFLAAMIILTRNEDGEEENVLAFPYKSKENAFEIAAQEIAQKEGVELFVGTENLSFYEDNQIVVKRIKNTYSFLCFLHEMAHITFFRQKREFDHILFEELLCWQYAFNQIKKIYELKREDIKKCLKSFDTYIEFHGLDPSWRSEILKLRKKIFAL